ncbi:MULTISPECIES: nuclear transport factor 2 family protein [Streptomyces]|uniref:nuclear transport factor 2 family protein n=1 Tax=Streptomyces TaxID=1883 RepID=UPI000CD4DF8A|nr:MULTISPECIES: nuclear transport factor 2 family protein [Streptomyces]
MEPAEVVRELWARVEARDWPGVGALIARDATVEWPVSAELIEGRENFVSVNSEYPEGWSIRVLRVVADGESVVSEVEVPQEGVGVFRAVSFWTVRDGLVTAGREYWTSPGAEEPPAWRTPYTRRLPR